MAHNEPSAAPNVVAEHKPFIPANQDIPEFSMKAVDKRVGAKGGRN